MTTDGGKSIRFFLQLSHYQRYTAAMTDMDTDYQHHPNLFGSGPDPLLARHLNLLTPERGPVLDVGAGQGRHALYLAAHGYHVVAVEPSPTACRQLVDEAGKAGFHQVTVRCSTLEAFQTRDRFQAVLLFGLLQLLTPDQMNDLVRRCRQLTLPGGLLFVTAFHTSDSGHGEWRDRATRIAADCYRDACGRVRSWLSTDAFHALFSNWETISTDLFTGPIHRHGTGPAEQHRVLAGLFRRP